MAKDAAVLVGVGAYVVDTDPWIDAWRLYPPDVFPTFWEHVGVLVAEGRLISPDVVRDELGQVTDDGLAEHLEQYEGLFRPIDEPVQFAVRSLLEELPSFAEPNAVRTKADPFVVAMAVVIQGIVVSKENPSRSAGHVKIPDACKHRGLRVVRLIELMREIGIRL
jgi:hypothetical protein